MWFSRRAAVSKDELPFYEWELAPLTHGEHEVCLQLRIFESEVGDKGLAADLVLKDVMAKTSSARCKLMA